MKAAFERFDGSRLTKDLPRVGDESTVILVPRRSSMLGFEIFDYMRFNKTEEIHEGLPLFRQSKEKLDGVVIDDGSVKSDAVL